MCGVLIFLAGLVFGVGYLIGYAAFKKSPKRTSFAVLSGVTALVVTVGILFAGCLVLLQNTNFH